MPDPLSQMVSTRRQIAVPLVATLLLACSPHQVRKDPPPPVKLPGRFAQQSAQPEPGADVAKVAWWQTLSDPELSALVQRALSGNFDVQAAFARLQQARAVADIAGAPQLPSLDLAITPNARSINPAAFGARNAGTIKNYGVTGSLSAAYEVDVWAKISSGKKAAVLDRAAADDRVQAMAMSIAAEVAGAYYDLVSARAQVTLLTSQRDLSQSFLEVVELRFGEGLADAVEVEQQRQLVITASAALEQLVAAEAVAAHRLALLSGQAPGSLALPGRLDLPKLPALPQLGVPSELLQQRPDLRAARRRVEAADYRIAVAVADRYPSLRLTGALTSQPSKLNDFLLDPIWELAANLAMPLFDNGRRSAEVDRTRAVMAEAVADYGTAVLTALVEVENALVQERQQRAQIARIEEQMEVAERTLRQAQDRYGQGVSDYLSVLTALRSAQDVERALLDARRALLGHRISLYRALGGTWTQSLQPKAANSDAEEPS